MTRLPYALSAIVFLALAACSGESAPSHAPTVSNPSPRVPELAALRVLLAPHASARFDADAQERGCPADQNLGEYLEMLAHNGEVGDAPGDVHHLTGGCDDAAVSAQRIPIDPPPSAAYWFCRVDSYLSDPEGESPWHYELHLRVRKADAAPDLSTMACPGTP